MSNDSDTVAAAPNAKRLLWAGFMAILAAGVGFSVRGGILVQWAEDFGFTMTELGTITGGGLTGFGVVIIVTSLFADAIGYGKLMTGAFVLHFISAVITLAAPAAFEAGGKDAAFQCLFWGMFIFAVGNGVCEAVVNPLTATLFPKSKTHYLNILHAGWPAGLVIGGLASAFMAAKVDTDGTILKAAVDWKIQMSLFLVPVILYGGMLLGQRFPKSEAAAAGVSTGQMLASVVTPLFFFLLVLHALVGYVELGTDSWISKITGSIMNDPQKGLMLFVYTSSLMFALRFVAGPIVHRISPLGLLFVSSILGALGLTLLGTATSLLMCVVAATVYACGKTFLWPTMLAVGSERFPKGGAVAIGLMGGVGMLSAGLIGGPAIGYKQDYYASQDLRDNAEPTYERYAVEKPEGFLFLPKINGLDGAKVGVLGDQGKELAAVGEALAADGQTDENYNKLAAWWESAKPFASEDKAPVSAATLAGGRMALQLTAAVPTVMAILYLLLILGFKAVGGYKAIHIDDSELLTGGVEGPMEA
ncbi:Major Facilitator Superfamily protein [Rosistilla carotiformis]|uniref:Major Facilitator Superfamily protein n=1 Tax=Rosistilla carotiformis TaxID=2528017 RepID=A0A518JQI5_9BACT|nr:MFS transporter [Rosistilla carotiformis]QDV67795.1 Major Facilitator Superfamily protein [Rosistilla carotiformis]